MAERMIRVCDGCQEPATDQAVFEYRRSVYRVDVCKKHMVEIAELIGALEGWAGKGRALSRRGTQDFLSSAGRTTRADYPAIRAWAAEQGLTIAQHGRIATKTIKAYYDAMGPTPSGAE